MVGFVIDRAFDHLNYLRWGTVYLTDMEMLQEVATTVHQENRAHAVSTLSSQSAFNSFSPDMALEQTVNRDSKTKEKLLELLAWRAQEIGGPS